MKKTVWLLLMCLFTASAYGVGGVGVGNGGDTCYTVASGLTIRYATSLLLKVSSKNAFEISNANLVVAPQKPSSISFAVTRDEITDVKDLPSYVARAYPTKVFAPLSKPGAQGVYWESRTPTTLDGLYLLLTTNGDFVKVTVSANADGNGLSLIEPIVRSIAYDVSPPVITEMRFENKVWKAGSRQKVFVRMTDDYSGVAESSPDFIWFYNTAGKQPIVVFKYDISKLHFEGGDLYSFEFTVSPYAVSEEVKLGSVDFSDRAGNSRQLYISDKSPLTYVQHGGPKLPVIAATIVNDQTADLTAPVVLGIEARVPIWKTGSTQRVYLHVTDDLSGFDKDWIETYGSGATSTFKKAGRHFQFFPSSTKGRDEGGGWYSLEMKVPAYLPSGEYLFATFSLTDNAGNHRYVGLDEKDKTYYHEVTETTPERATNIPILKIQVQNDGAEDLQAPKVVDWRIDPIVAAGGRGRFYFRANDDVSGIELKNMGHLFIYGDDKTNAEGDIGTHGAYPNLVRSEGNDWYSFEFEVGAYAKSGLYYVGSLEISDRARNQVEINCIHTSDCRVNNVDPSPLPRLTFTVTR